MPEAHKHERIEKGIGVLRQNVDALKQQNASRM
jgi:hypothetical protein